MVFSDFDEGKNYEFCDCTFDELDFKLFEEFENVLKREPKRYHNFSVEKGHDPPDDWFEWKDELHNIYMKLRNKEMVLLKKKYSPKFISWNWLTISPRPMLESEQLDDFEKFVRGIMSDKYLSEYYFVIECGKNPDKPNYHAHMLYRFKNANVGKNFKRDCVRRFDKMFQCEKGIDWFSS